MDDKQREIRRILLGHTHRQEDGRLAAEEPGTRFAFQGVRNGWSAVRIFGVGCTAREYSCPREEALHRVYTAFSHVGSEIRLKTMPQAQCSLYRPAMGMPILLTAELQEEGILLAAYSGRSPLAPLLRKLLLGKAEKHLPESFVRQQKKEAKPPIDPGAIMQVLLETGKLLQKKLAAIRPGQRKNK